MTENGEISLKVMRISRPLLQADQSIYAEDDDLIGLINQFIHLDLQKLILDYCI